jgi:hypothetical protein
MTGSSMKPFSQEYQTYIASEAWYRRRALKLLLTGGASGFVRCEHCHSQHGCQYVHVHHLTYERLGHEPFNDLMILCSQCHGSVKEIDAVANGGDAIEIGDALLSRLRAIDNRIGAPPLPPPREPAAPKHGLSSIGELAEIIARKRAEAGIVQKDTGP